MSSPISNVIPLQLLRLGTYSLGMTVVQLMRRQRMSLLLLVFDICKDEVCIDKHSK